VRVVVSGSTGLIGSALVASLRERGDDVFRLVRTPVRREDELHWDPDAGAIDADRLGALAPDAVIHLAGESIGGGRWTRERKRRIRESRTRGTRLVSEIVARLSPPPAAMVCASAVGYYGDRGDEVLTEASPPGTGFLAEVTKEWEEATAAAREAGVLVVTTRFGIVLSADGGALPRMLLPFRLGLGGRLGSGRQYFSWVALDDVVGAVVHLLGAEELAGAVNVTAPNPVTNRELTQTLSRVLRRPAVVPVPAVVLRVALGEIAQDLLGGQRAHPERLLASGYEFRHQELEPALRDLLGSSNI
jgi:uncharacterized protein (TIGR01777 family)